MSVALSIPRVQLVPPVVSSMTAVLSAAQWVLDRFLCFLRLADATMALTPPAERLLSVACWGKGKADGQSGIGIKLSVVG